MGPNGAKDALMRAVVLLDEDAALEAAAAGGGVGRRERETGYTALHHACQYGMLRLVALLLDRRAELGAQTKDLVLQSAVVDAGGQTPLHLAARSGETDVAELLLAHRADPSTQDLDGATPATAALQHRQRGLAERLAVAAATPLPSEAALAELSLAATEARRVRAAAQLEVPAHLRQVYVLPAVWSSEECSHVLAALADGPGWTTGRHAAYATTDVPCSAVTDVDGWVRASLRSKVLPRLAARHGWLPAGSTGDGCEADAARLAFRDLFFVQYSAAAGRQSGLALHRDGSIISFNILLNDPTSFEGGGTYVEAFPLATLKEADDHTYQIAQGDCLVHSGKLRHGGSPVTSGERYVLVAFVDVLDSEEVLEADEA